MASAAQPVSAWFGWRTIAALCRRPLAEADWRLEGIEHVPASGPVLLVARHVHHALDGCILQRSLPRPLRILVAIDWVVPGWQRRVMDWACRTLEWPTVVRPDNPSGLPPDRTARLLREATKATVRLLRAGEVLLVFPEGYPNVDPNPTPKPDLDDWLPFSPGFVRLARLAERDGRTRVAIVPVGFGYVFDGSWRVAARLDPPRFLSETGDDAEFLKEIETRVRALSAPPDRSGSD